MAGSVFGIFMPDPEIIVLPWNIKRRCAILKYLREHQTDKSCPFKQNDIKYIENLMKETRDARKKIIPQKFSSWVFARWQDEQFYPPKTDGYGLPGGEIDEYELKKYQNNYFDYALPREFAEETGLIAVKETSKKDENGKIIMENLFKRVCLLWAKNKNEDGGKTYENFFFHVFDTDPQSALNSEGVENETEPSELVPIAKLGTSGFPFYPKHAIGLKIFLRQMVKAGNTEYEPSLKHIEEKYPWTLEQRGLSYKRLDPEPTVILTDEEAWLRATRGVKKI